MHFLLLIGIVGKALGSTALEENKVTQI